MALTILIAIVALSMAVIANSLLAPSAPSIDRNLSAPNAAAHSKRHPPAF
jgi:hypothetical protein